MHQGRTRLLKTTTKVQGKVYERMLVHTPSKIAGDSQFPFQAGQALSIEVDRTNRRIILSKMLEEQKASRRRRS